MSLYTELEVSLPLEPPVVPLCRPLVKVMPSFLSPSSLYTPPILSFLFALCFRPAYTLVQPVLSLVRSVTMSSLPERPEMRAQWIWQGVSREGKGRHSTSLLSLSLTGPPLALWLPFWATAIIGMCGLLTPSASSFLINYKMIRSFMPSYSTS